MTFCLLAYFLGVIALASVSAPDPRGIMRLSPCETLVFVFAWPLVPLLLCWLAAREVCLAAWEGAAQYLE